MSKRKLTENGLIIKISNADWFSKEELADIVARLHSELTRLKELNREMVELLKELPKNVLRSSSQYCPYCHNDLIMGHDEDCRYVLILAKAEEEGE